jgi:hypothetical protein
LHDNQRSYRSPVSLGHFEQALPPREEVESIPTIEALAGEGIEEIPTKLGA